MDENLGLPPEADCEVSDAAKVVRASERAEGVVGEGVSVEEGLACHTAHLSKPRQFSFGLVGKVNFIGMSMDLTIELTIESHIVPYSLKRFRDYILTIEFNN